MLDIWHDLLETYVQGLCKRDHFGETHLGILHWRVKKRILSLGVKEHVYQMAVSVSGTLQEFPPVGVNTLLHNSQTAVRPRDSYPPVNLCQSANCPQGQD